MLLIVFLLFVWCGRTFTQEWVRSSPGEIPDYALPAGTDKYNSVTYVCRAYFKTETCVGRVNANLRNCHIPYFEKEYQVSNYDVLVSPPWAEYKLAWYILPLTNGKVPANAVSAAPGVYVGRCRIDGHNIPGKIVQKTNSFYYGYDGVEYRLERYYALRKMLRSVDHYELHSVSYDLLNRSHDLSSNQVILSQETVTNENPYDTTSLLSIKFKNIKTSDWSQMNGVEIQEGIGISVTAEIPYVKISGEVNWGSTESASNTQGGSYEMTETSTQEIKVNLPAYSNAYVVMLAKKETISIPYVGILRIFFTNRDGYEQVEIEGVYEGVQYTSFKTSVKNSPFETNGTGVIKPVSLLSVWIAVSFLSL